MAKLGIRVWHVQTLALPLPFPRNLCSGPNRERSRGNRGESATPSESLCQTVPWRLCGGKQGPQSIAKLVAREAKSWGGLSEMEGHFPPRNELSQLRQVVNKLVQSAPSPVLRRRKLRPSHWSFHLTLTPFSSVGEQWTLPLYDPGWDGGNSELRSLKEPLLPAQWSQGTRAFSWETLLPDACREGK